MTVPAQSQRKETNRTAKKALLRRTSRTEPTSTCIRTSVQLQLSIIHRICLITPALQPSQRMGALTFASSDAVGGTEEKGVRSLLTNFRYSQMAAMTDSTITSKLVRSFPSVSASSFRSPPSPPPSPQFSKAGGSGCAHGLSFREADGKTRRTMLSDCGCEAAS